MNPKKAKSEFEELLKTKAADIASITATKGIELMLDFYRDVRAKGCEEADSDMLLFQWGEDGARRAFEVDITRQLIFSGWTDENIWQLSLTFSCPLVAEMGTIASGNKWCSKPHPKAIEHFKGFIHSSEAYAAINDANAVKAELDYFNAG